MKKGRLITPNMVYALYLVFYRSRLFRFGRIRIVKDIYILGIEFSICCGDEG